MKITREQLESVLDAHVPRWRAHSIIEALGERAITIRMPFTADLVRAGNTLSGPALMGLADRAAYMLAMVHAGGDPTIVTANLDIHFLARPAPVDATAIATLLRAGKRLVVSMVEIRAAAHLVAHATVTYAVTPTGSQVYSSYT